MLGRMPDICSLERGLEEQERVLAVLQVERAAGKLALNLAQDLSPTCAFTVSRVCRGPGWASSQSRGEERRGEDRQERSEKREERKAWQVKQGSKAQETDLEVERHVCRDDQRDDRRPKLFLELGLHPEGDVILLVVEDLKALCVRASTLERKIYGKSKSESERG